MGVALDVLAQELRPLAALATEAADVVEEARVVLGILDRRHDRLGPRVGPGEHRLDLILHRVEAVDEGLEELEVVVGVGVDDLEDVADDRVPRRVEAERIDQRRRILEDPQERVEVEVDPLRPVVVGGTRGDPEAGHVEGADDPLDPRRHLVDPAELLEALEAGLDPILVPVGPQGCGEVADLLAACWTTPHDAANQPQRGLSEACGGLLHDRVKISE